MGVKQWLFQRSSNLVFVLFGAWFLISVISGAFNDYAGINTLLGSAAAKAVLAIVLLLAALNSILAGWQIAGDYAHKINVSSGVIVAIVAIISIAYLVVGIGALY